MPVFGVARRYGKDIDTLLQKLRENSVEAYEIGFAYGVPSKFPKRTAKLAKELKIKLSGHIPFFISWSSEEKTLQSVEHISKGIMFAAQLQTISVCHLGYYGTRSFEELRHAIVRGINDAIDLAKEHRDFKTPVLGIETTGKKSEIGSLDEVLSIVNDLSIDVAVPVIDWAHIFARSNGKFPRRLEDFRLVVTRLENEIGLRNFYFHGSGIEYKNGQERRHLSVKTCRPPLPYLLAVMNEMGYDYTLIVESPDTIEDMIWLRKVSRNPEAWFGFVENPTGLLDRWITK
ncbi:hypothetical protein E3J74_04450 [Candidatus Bathyarchaeota archaeon]|nr:MAG: hypothetical protein E3J74_04450 [Candidatus Bathyarchaeota archaeon]